jgi:hypothetical protein
VGDPLPTIRKCFEQTGRGFSCRYIAGEQAIDLTSFRYPGSPVPLASESQDYGAQISFLVRVFADSFPLQKIKLTGVRFPKRKPYRVLLGLGTSGDLHYEEVTRVMQGITRVKIFCIGKNLQGEAEEYSEDGAVVYFSIHEVHKLCLLAERILKRPLAIERRLSGDNLQVYHLALPN